MDGRATSGSDSSPVDSSPVDSSPFDSSLVESPAAEDGTVEWTPPTWEEVVTAHSARVYRLAYRLTGNAHDAQDLTQDVFVRVFRSLSSYTPGTFEGWLHRITTNLFLDGVRRKARIRFEALPEDTDRLAAPGDGPEQTWLDGQLDGDIEAALASLPPDFRAAVVLCDLEQLSYEEIAATLGLKLGTVRSRIHRGRTQLRTALAHRAPAATRRGDAAPVEAPSPVDAPAVLPGPMPSVDRGRRAAADRGDLATASAATG